MASPLSPPAPPGFAPSAPPSGSPAHGAAAPADRTLGRRSGLPNGRAIIGGLLVMVAAVATFAAIAGARTGPTHTYVVARSEIRAGQRIAESDLRVVTGDLPSDIDAQTFSRTEPLAGAVALGPIAADDIVTPSRVRVATDAESALTRAHELTFAVDKANMLNGTLQRGELIDVVVTYGTGDTARTEMVARRARVLDTSEPGSRSVGIDEQYSLTIALGPESEVLKAAHALEIGKVRVVRATRADEQGPETNTYQLPAANRGDPSGSGSAGSGGGSPSATTATTVAPENGNR